MILHIYADYNKRLGAYKITYVLKRDYGINISVGRVYRLMKQLQLPRMSTDKSRVSGNQSENTDCAFSFRQLLDSLNAVQSFSKKSYPFDNACCEGFYNSKRPHSTLNMLTPNEAETSYWEQNP